MKDANYTDEFKANAVRMVLEDGLTCTGVIVERISDNVIRRMVVIKHSAQTFQYCALLH